MVKAGKTYCIKCIRVLESFIAINLCRSICQMHANSPGVKSFRVHLGSNRERKYYRRLPSPLLTYWEISRRIRAVTAKKCTKKCDARTELLFCSLNLLLFSQS